MSSSATLDSAIRQRWIDKNLEAAFKKFWDDQTLASVHAFNDSDARPNTPMPYCVYEKLTPVPTFNSTGSQCEPQDHIEYLTVPIQFTIYAANKTSGTHKGRSGKDIAAELLGNGLPDATGILGAFEDAAGNLSLGGTDRHIQTIVGVDFAQREDDDVWSWTVTFDVQIERRRRLRQPV